MSGVPRDVERITIGSVWETRDRREAGRRLVVVATGNSHVTLRPVTDLTARPTRIRPDVLRRRFRRLTERPPADLASR